MSTRPPEEIATVNKVRVHKELTTFAVVWIVASYGVGLIVAAVYKAVTS